MGGGTTRLIALHVLPNLVRTFKIRFQKLALFGTVGSGSAKKLFLGTLATTPWATVTTFVVGLAL